MKEVFDGSWNECVNHDVADVIDEYGPGQYVVAIRSSQCGVPVGISLTTDIDSVPLPLNPLGSALGTWPTSALPPCHVRVSKGTSETQVFVLAGSCNWNGNWGTPPDQLWHFTGRNWHAKS